MYQVLLHTSLIALQGVSWLLRVTTTSNGSLTLDLDNKANAGMYDELPTRTDVQQVLLEL